MAALEAALGAKLLARRTHGSELTDAGAALLDTLERVETEMLGVQSRLQGAEAAAAGVVRIGAPDGFGVGFLAPRLAAAGRAPSRPDGAARADAARLLAVAPRGRPRGDGRPARARAASSRAS